MRHLVAFVTLCRDSRAILSAFIQSIIGTSTDKKTASSNGLGVLASGSTSGLAVPFAWQK